MAQSSWPRTVGTPAQRQFTDVQWGDLFGRDSGIVEDYDGTSYALTLSANSDTVSVGSSTQDSMALVGGFGHKIPLGSPEQLTIAPASGSAQATIVALRYDAASTDAAGPCRLVTYPNPGTADGAPVASSLPVGSVVLPLWSVTRQPAQVLSTATIRSLRRWLGSTLYADVVAPASAPLGTIVRMPGQRVMQRQLSTTGTVTGPVWVDPTARRQDPTLVTSLPNWNMTGTTETFDIGSFSLAYASVATITITMDVKVRTPTGGALPEVLLSALLDGVVVGNGAVVSASTSLQFPVGFLIAQAMAAGDHKLAIRAQVTNATPSAFTFVRAASLITPGTP